MSISDTDRFKGWRLLLSVGTWLTCPTVVAAFPPPAQDCPVTAGAASINGATIGGAYQCLAAASVQTTGSVQIDPGADVLLGAPIVVLETGFNVLQGARFRVIYDQTPPTPPSGLQLLANNTSELAFEWSAGSDAVGVADYLIRRDGADLTVVSDLLLFDAGLAASTAYNYEVATRDGSGNRSSFVPINLATSGASPTTSRGPYLQQGGSEQMRVHWRTPTNEVSRIFYGTDPANLDHMIEGGGATTEHRITLSGLAPDTRYYYRVQSGSGLVGGADTTFRTAPSPGSIKPVRIWVLGDSGTANNNARAVRDAYLEITGDQPTDLLLMLGDNAYNNGTDSEYQNAVFDMYPQLLPNTPLWSTLGNHDGYSADSATETGPYYDIFDPPTQGETGGVPSGTEAYYSFDYANIHFVCLDSYDSDRSLNGPMYQWLQLDLAANQQPWTIAFWHHPPYSKGTHNSDTEAPLIEMRERFAALLESYGVDLVLSGHSHAYERSYLIDGHYGSSGTYDPATHLVDGGDGRVGGAGAYQKDDIPHDGTVYVVAGSSGQAGGGSLNHPVMFASLNSLGSMLLELNDTRLDAYFLDHRGNMPDRFTLIKDASYQAPAIQQATFDVVADATAGSNGQSGNGTIIEADGDDAGSELRGLFRWDLGTLPAGAQIVSASLEVDVDNVSTGRYQWYQARSAWSEAAAAWSQASDLGVLTGAWTPSALGTQQIPLNSSGVALVQQWADGIDNNGLILKSAGTTDGVDIGSREASRAASLHLKYFLPPP